MELHAAMALAAARTPGAAFMTLDGRHAGHRKALLALGGEALVHVPAENPERAVEAFASAIDALRGERGGDRDLPLAWGWITYDAARCAASARAFTDTRPRGDACASAWLSRHDAVLALDLTTGELTLPQDADQARRLRDALDDARGRSCERSPLDFTSATDETSHHDAVETVRAAIGRGEVYLVNVARTLHAPRATPEALTARVVDAAPRYGFIQNTGEVTVAGMSMELALAWDRSRDLARTRPIKGTRPRDSDPTRDRAQALALARDPKERAENVMAVDVHRNDLGRVARAGSVHVPELCVTEAHRYVHHLVSTVTAEVARDTPTVELLRAMLPVGSVTGAPKLAAMDFIARVERERRGLYTGVYGCVWGDGSVELAVAIRTMVSDARGTHYGVGGGIVWDSDPAREWDEMEWKQRAASH